VKDQFIGCRICKNVEVLDSDEKENMHYVLKVARMTRHLQWKQKSESAIYFKGKEMSNTIIPSRILWLCQYKSKPKKIKLNKEF
jgi:hypothetical protein